MLKSVINLFLKLDNRKSSVFAEKGLLPLKVGLESVSIEEVLDYERYSEVFPRSERLRIYRNR